MGEKCFTVVQTTVGTSNWVGTNAHLMPRNVLLAMTPIKGKISRREGLQDCLCKSCWARAGTDLTPNPNTWLEVRSVESPQFGGEKWARKVLTPPNAVWSEYPAWAGSDWSRDEQTVATAT